MNKRLCSATSLLLLAVGLAFGAEATGELPNILIMYADDLGYGDLAIQNSNSQIATPNLDELARQGMRFTDAHSSSGICTPSRYALLTGRYHWRKFHGIVNSWCDSVLAADRLTLPEILRHQGYHTACIGKWHLGFDWSALRKKGADDSNDAAAFDWSRPIPNGPLDHGFDYYFGDDVPNFPPYTWIENDRVTAAPTVPMAPNPPPAEGAPECRPGPMVEGWRLDAVMPKLTERAVDWIAEQRGADRPFFLYWAWTSPHAPIVPTVRWRDASNAGAYGDYVSQSDHHAGEVLRALADNGFGENTIVIFTSDNGPEAYAYARTRNFGHASSGPLRGLKRDIWEGGHRVPFIVRWPGVVSAGAVSDELMSQIDLMATLASVVDFALPKNAANDSHDQLSLWKGGPSARASLVHNTRKDHYAIRRGEWVLIDAPSGDVSTVPRWYADTHGFAANPHPGALFDLDSDVGQRKNLFGSRPQLVAELRELLNAKRTSGEVRP